MPAPARPIRSAVCVFGLATAITLLASTLSVAKNHQDAAVEPPLPVKTKSGLVYQELVTGTGRSPAIDNVVLAHYHGTLADGTVFDSSVDRGSPTSFGVTQVIQGWIEGLQLMNVGSKYKFFIPYNLAYGERGAGQAIPPFATLIFEVELLSIE